MIGTRFLELSKLRDEQIAKIKNLGKKKEEAKQKENDEYNEGLRHWYSSFAVKDRFYGHHTNPNPSLCEFCKKQLSLLIRFDDNSCFDCRISQAKIELVKTEWLLREFSIGLVTKEIEVVTIVTKTADEVKAEVAQEIWYDKLRAYAASPESLYK